MLRVAWRGADGCFHGPGRNGVLSACRSLQSIDGLVASGAGMLQRRLGEVYKTGGFQVSQIKYVAVQDCCCSGVAGLFLARDVRCFFRVDLGGILFGDPSRDSSWCCRLVFRSRPRPGLELGGEVGGRGCV
jgi:hypothetical protein